MVQNFLNHGAIAFNRNYIEVVNYETMELKYSTLFFKGELHYVNKLWYTDL